MVGFFQRNAADLHPHRCWKTNLFKENLQDNIDIKTGVEVGLLVG